jgi:hypothetical protein
MALDLDALETSFDLVAPRGDELLDRSPARAGGPNTDVRGRTPSRSSPE